MNTSPYLDLRSGPKNESLKVNGASPSAFSQQGQSGLVLALRRHNQPHHHYRYGVLYVPSLSIPGMELLKQ